ncbi:2,3-oxidosqualene cyclase [Methylomagnum ishizawai]|uniref:2,3-oxidosqualene cyclase n=1 Tax=Methylomagnum ishizawai TaxID=1760988 RepID=UPI001C32EB49|nr:2,3-oxidosqualene cyclase [Methylomagnum ishizawai]BBL76193.1 squalene-hopene cyclase [Methylomagnum ishizawai]
MNNQTTEFNDLPRAPMAAPAHGPEREAGRRALSRLLELQGGNGDWEGEMVWCTMILAQTVIVRAVAGRPYSEDERARIVRHFAHYQDAEGAWGMHPESPGYVFFTALAYVALRILGLSADDPMLVRARTWLHAQPGGVKGIPTWGKFWLALLGLYDYAGLNSVPPELFILPQWLPFHPRRFYCHTRLIYLGIAYLFGVRFVAPLPDGLREQLRAELYTEPYASIDFAQLRHSLAPGDVHVPISPLLRTIYDGLALYERWHLKALRRKALAACFERILYEQRTTRYQGISPVNGLLNCLAIFAHDPQHHELQASLAGAEAWRWEDEVEGIRYVGARSNTWDTAFVVQAFMEAPGTVPGSVDAMDRAVGFFKQAQMTEELPDDRNYWRDTAVGGWCFSDGQHRWPVSDCTAEAVSALLALRERPEYRDVQPFAPERLGQAVAFILSRQNADGGFGTYERRRAGKLLEAINPSEMFGQCMTELSYIECTASSLAALADYRKHHPDPTGTIDRAIARAVALLRSAQLPDGAYAGFWGINYTYAIFHVAKGLRAADIPAGDPALQAAALWLVGKQRADGGWGEHYSSCLEGRYIEHSHSQVVMTSWALLALLDILPPDHPAIAQGVAWLVGQQQADGDWPRQGVNGVFFGAAMLDYRLYHTYFPAWALARHARLHGTR